MDLPLGNDWQPPPQWSHILNCTNIRLAHINTGNLTLGITAIICLIIALVILFVLLFYKQYKTTLQRFFLYLTVMTVVKEAGLGVVLEHQFHYRYQDQFCEVLGYFNQSMSTIIYVITAQIAVYLVYDVYIKLRIDQLSKVSQSGCLVKLLQGLYLIVPLLLAILVTAYPYLGGNKYGLSIENCWIRAFDEDCKSVGFKYQVIAYGIDGGLGLVSVTATLVLAVVYCRMAHKYRHVAKSEIMLLLRQTMLLMAFILSSLVWFVVRIFALLPKYNSYVLSLANSVGINVSLLVMPVGYLVYIYATSHSRNNCCSRCLSKCRSKFRKSKTRHVRLPRNPAPGITEQNNKTNPSSHPQHVPSETYFVIEHTGQFTHIPATINDTAPSIQKTMLPNGKHSPVHVPHNPVPSSTFFNVEYTGQFTEITDEVVTQGEGQSLISNTTDTGYNTMT